MKNNINYWSGDNLISKDIKFIFDGKQSTLVFTKISSEWNTLITLFNYWSFNYSKKNISFIVEYVNSDGECIYKKNYELLDKNTKIIDVSKELNEIGIFEFEGSTRLNLSFDKLVSELPLQLLADYIFCDNISCVHGQGSLTDYQYPQRSHMISVKEHDGWRTSFDLKNNYIGKEELPFNEAKIELFNFKGLSKKIKIPLPKKGSGKRYYISNIFNDISPFLGDKNGHLRVTTPYKSHRTFYIQENVKSKSITVNHGTVEHNFNYPEWSGIPIDNYKKIKSAPRTIAPVLINKDLTSGVILINTFGPPEGKRVLKIDFFSETGSDKPAKVYELELDKRETKTLMFKDLINDDNFCGHAAIYLPYRDIDNLDYPRQVDCIPIIEKGGDSASTHVGSAVFNIETSNEYFRKSGTRIFSRMLNSDKFETEAIIIYPTSNQPSPKNGLAEISFIKESGDIISREIIIPRNGLVKLKFDKFDNEVTNFLTNQTHYTLMVKSKNFKFYGFHLTTKKNSSRGIAMDHFFGG